ncbi:DUF975 family protein [Enterococcus sp. LJL128]|uniref:DUF975 family protein n=1 Tax=Enterococcus sp. LJL51 TaxID=3416656 RepID=UPI003CF2A7F9
MNNQVTNAEHRERARKALSGKWGTMALLIFCGFLVRMIISTLVGSVFPMESGSNGENLVSFLLNNLLFFAFTYGTYNAALQVIRGRSVDISLLTSIFRKELYLPMLIINFIQYLVQLLVNLITLLPVLLTAGLTMYLGLMFNTVSVAQFQNEMASDGLLAVVMLLFSLALLLVGIFISGVFQFAVWIKLDQPNLGVGDILRDAFGLMKGRFKQYFFLQLSFVGWYILGAMALGIGLFWVIPYHDVAVASFYDSAQREKSPF